MSPAPRGRSRGLPDRFPIRRPLGRAGSRRVGSTLRRRVRRELEGLLVEGHARGGVQIRRKARRA